MPISIHALARRATDDPRSPHYGMPISIHALARRATLRSAFALQRFYISIHALARRATLSVAHLRSNGFTFQSTLSQGERLVIIKLAKGVKVISIHALARRATANKSRDIIRFKYFNPRSRKESDLSVSAFPFRAYWFQSTLSQGERPAVKPDVLKPKGFQSTLSQGERPFFFFVPYRLLWFQSTLSQGERPVTPVFLVYIY